MPVKISTSVRIPILVGEEKVIFVCRRPTAQELSQFLNSRFISRRNKMESRIYEARAAFFDKVAIDAENITFENAAGEDVALNATTPLTAADVAKWTAAMGKPVASWRDLIAENWKSAVAMRFEDSVGEVPDDEEDSQKN